MAKEFIYKGKTLDELKSMDVREFAKISPSRTRRKIMRQYDKVEKFVKRCLEKAARGKKIRTHSRSMIVVPQMVGLTLYIHNGKEFLPVLILPEMVCHYLGEFSLTRRKVQHSAPGIGATRSSAALSVK
ncbi:MAG: 30S ribosomal protein S19 [Nanoarchaeota archaeon]|nr:30S ribosomal protein S19 [Nanoarchaeota archaeon]